MLAAARLEVVHYVGLAHHARRRSGPFASDRAHAPPGFSARRGRGRRGGGAATEADAAARGLARGSPAWWGQEATCHPAAMTRCATTASPIRRWPCASG